jgi:hypothetical protein
MSDFYTTTRIVHTVRSLMNDMVAPYYVSDEQLVDFINRRARELCKVSLALFTAGRIKLRARAGEPWLNVPESVIRARALVGEGLTLHPVPFSRITHESLYWDYGLRMDGNWRERHGRPECFVTDMEEGRWRLYPIPETNIGFAMEGWLYNDPIRSVTQNLDMHDRCLENLHLGVLASCFGIEDADAIYDPKKEREYEDRWLAELTAQKAFHNRDNRDTGRAVRYGGY